MRKLILILAALSAAVAVALGCGNEDEAASAAAELVPAGAVIYGEVTLKPEGDQKEAVDAIVSKFPGGSQAGETLKELIEKGLRESDAQITFKDDVEPWLGDSAAGFASNFNASSGEFGATAGLIATDDEDAAQETLEKSAEGKITRKTYKDVEYLMDEAEETNTGMVHNGFVVLGTEAGVKAVIDASEGDSKLSDDERYKSAVEDAAEDRLGFIYVDGRRFLQAAGPAGAALPDSFKKSFDEPIVATVDADEDGVVLESTIPEELARNFGFLGQASPLMDELPADAWLAAAQKDFGGLIDYFADSFGAAVGGRDNVERQLEAATGLDLQRDVIDWMGDFGVFVRGSRVADLDGALVIETSDEAASGRFLTALERLARGQSESGLQVRPLSAPGGGDGFSVSGAGIPKPVHAFQRGGRVVFAYGDTAAQDAVDAGETLGDSSEFTEARDSLGDYDVSFYLQMQSIFDLVDSTEAASDADWQEAKPYLEPIRALVSGITGEGDGSKSALKLVVK